MDNSMRQFNILSHNLVVGRAHIYTSGGCAANMGTPLTDRKTALKNAPNGRSPLNRLAIRPYLGARTFQLLFRIFAIVSGLTSPIYKPSSQHLKSSNKIYLSA